MTMLEVRWDKLGTYGSLDDIFRVVAHSRYAPADFAIGARRGKAFTWYVLYQRQLCL